MENIIKTTPTNPLDVNNNTPLEDLNLNWGEKDMPEKERTKHVHRLHPYLGKFIPQLVEIFLRKYFEPGQTILDPFCGSGTTLVQANELGINSIGYDISAFNVLLTKAKTHKYDTDIATFEIKDALEKLHDLTQLNIDHQLPLWESKSANREYSTNDDYLNLWFSPRALIEILAYRSIIQNSKYKYKNLLNIILSRSARSARLVKHFDLDFPKKPQTEPYDCYKHSRVCKPVEEAYKFIRRYSIDTIKRVQEFSTLRTNARVKIVHGNSITARFPKIDGVITSPPYVGLIDYHEQHTYAYHLLGLEDKREKEIGPAAKGSSISAKENYQELLVKVFSRAAKAMKDDGVIITIAGDKHDLYDEIAVGAGLEIHDVVKRHVNRRTGRRSSEFYESVFIWKKAKRLC